MCLGDNIRFLRTKHGLSQDDIADKLGYKSFTTIQKWESGVSEPPLKALKKLADIFKVDMDDLATKKLYLGETSSSDTYYLNDDAKEMAQFLYENPDYKVLFDASRKVKKEDIAFVKEFLDRFKGDDNY